MSGGVAILKACPLCDSQPSMSHYDENEYTSYRRVQTVTCKGCGVSISRFGDNSRPGYADNSMVEENVISAWNKRVDEEVLFNLMMSVCECRTMTDFLTVQKTVNVIQDASKANHNRDSE